MKLFLFTLFFVAPVYSQTCSEVYSGTFEIETNAGKFIIERYDGYQLEYSEDLQVMYLNKVLKIDECQYQVKPYQVLKNEVLPALDMNSVLEVVIHKIEGKHFYFTTSMINSSVKLKGVMLKTDTDVSDELKELVNELNSKK